MIIKKLIIFSLLGFATFISEGNLKRDIKLLEYDNNIAKTTRPNLLLQFGKSIKINDPKGNDYLNTFVTGKDELCISLSNKEVPYFTFNPNQTKKLIKCVKQGLALMDLIKTDNLEITKELDQLKLGDYYSVSISIDNIGGQKKGSTIPYFLMKFDIEGAPFSLAKLNETTLKEFLEQLQTIDKVIQQVHKIQNVLDKEESAPQPSTEN